MPKDMHTFINEVVKERPGDIMVVDEELDPNLEVTGIAAKLAGWGRFPFSSRTPAPAVLCRKVKGSKIPCIVNLTASYDRLALSLGATKQNMVEAYVNRPQFKVPPKEVSKSEAPVKDIILTGKEARLSLLPLPTHNEHDAGPFITSGTMVCKDPDSGAHNAGIYRHQKLGDYKLGTWLWHSHHAEYIRMKYEEMGKDMEVAIVLGHHPGYILACIDKISGIGGEYEVAGSLMGEPLELVPAETVDLLVPARADIVIEGKIPAGKLAFEGPFAEWPGNYVESGEKPYIDVTAITMRKDAIYYDIFAAALEHTIVGGLPRMGAIHRMASEWVPGFKAVHVPSHCRMHCYISLKKISDLQVTRAAMAAYVVEPNNLRLIVVVDDDVDVFDEEEVMWAIGTRCLWDKDMTLLPQGGGPGGTNPAGWEFHEDGTRSRVKIAAMVLNATKPAPPIPYPPRARVPQELLDRLDPKMAKELKGL